MPGQERLFLLDGMALAYRAYYSFIRRPLINSKGQNTGAVYGFVTTLMKILEDERPEHIAVVFDTPEPTFRHERFPEYKATRESMPEDMVSQLPLVREVVRAFGAPLLELPGYEADDVMGTLARRAEAQGVRTYLVTGDKDFMQLISPLILMLRPGKATGEMEVVDESGVREKFGVAPSGVIDVLGLVGDTSDNVPGVPGVGEKTAIPLIQKYGSMAELYAHLDEIPQKGVREKLMSNRHLAFLSRELVTINTSAPVTIDFHELRTSTPDVRGLRELFERLEFRTLLDRLPGGAPPAGAPSAPPVPSENVGTIASDTHVYHCVTDASALEAMVARLSQAGTIVIDTETTSTDPLRAELVGVSLCAEEREAFYVPIRTAAGGPDLFAGGHAGEPNNTEGALGRETVLGALKPLLENPRLAKVGQNIKYDMLVLMRNGIAVDGVAHDTMVASYILRPDGQHGLDALAMEAFRYRMVSYEELVGKGKGARPITAVPLQSLAEYSCEDADFTMRVYHRQLEELPRTAQHDLCRRVEFPLIAVLAGMEFAGVSLDVDYLAGMSKDLERQLDVLVRDIHAAAGGPFNINSTKQLAEVLFSRLTLPAVRKTKTGLSTDVNVLESLRGRHPIIDLLLEYRQLVKLKSTYVDALPDLINPDTGRVHTSYNQTVAATGRLSSSDPNLQNIPIRTEIGRAIRRAFVPGRPDSVILSADYSQIELRIMAHVSDDPGLTEAFANDEDIHASTAAKVFGVDAADVTRDMRRKAKEVNFGIMYGIGPFGLANRLEIGQGEARDIIARYFERFPRVKQYIGDTIEGARTRGYVSTLLGRRRYLPDISSKNQNVRGNAERQAINMPIQGTAADMIKLAMISIDGAIARDRVEGTMLLQVHDELVFEVPSTALDAMTRIVRKEMEGALPLRVPVKVDIGAGRNWLEAH